MIETQFYQTAMGRNFYERDVPALVKEVGRLNSLLERLIEKQSVLPSANSGCCKGPEKL
jgi:hypothetical protein